MPIVHRVCKFKVVLLGDPEVGKTSLIRRYVHQSFSEDYQKTLGMSVAKRPEFVLLERGQSVETQLTIWDIMGQHASVELLKHSYLEGARGGLVLFDVTNPKSFEGLHYWLDLARHHEPRMPILVLGNKADLVDQRQLSDEEAEAACRAMGLQYLPASAKTGLNVQAAFARLALEIYSKLAPPEARTEAS